MSLLKVFFTLKCMLKRGFCVYWLIEYKRYLMQLYWIDWNIFKRIFFIEDYWHWYKQVKDRGFTRFDPSFFMETDVRLLRWSMVFDEGSWVVNFIGWSIVLNWGNHFCCVWNVWFWDWILITRLVFNLGLWIGD